MAEAKETLVAVNDKAMRRCTGTAQQATLLQQRLVLAEQMLLPALEDLEHSGVLILAVNS